MTLVNFTGARAVKWGATNLSKVYAGDVQVWPHPGPKPVSISLEDGFPYIDHEVNLTSGVRPALPVYEIPVGSNIAFAGSTSLRSNPVLEVQNYGVCDDTGTALGTLDEPQSRYSGAWTFPATGIAAGDISTIKGFMYSPTEAGSIPFGVIKWLPADGTFRRLPARPTRYQEITVDVSGQPIPGFPLSGTIYRAVNAGNATLLQEVTGFIDGTYRFVYTITGTTLSWALDVAIAGRWWTSGMTPVESDDGQWSVRTPRWGGQMAKSQYERNSALWTDNFAAGLVMDDQTGWRYARITHHGNLINNFHSSSANATTNIFTVLGIAIPAGLNMDELPTFSLDTNR